MPVRRVPRSYRGNLTGLHPNPSGGRSIAFESALERDFITLMLFDPDVVDVEEQPVRIPMPKGRFYTPDFLVTFRAGPRSLVEVKPADVLVRDHEMLAPKCAAAEAYAAARGWTFSVWTEERIRIPRMENARFLLPYRKRCPDASLVDAILACSAEVVGGGAEKILMAAFTDTETRARALAVIWHLVAVGRLGADLDLPLTQQSPFLRIAWEDANVG